MGFEVDEDILQDFLVEASEILEQLSEQLVTLERQPDDKDLLNAIFRGFHTVKGGAGFLSLTALVETCHKAENVFDILRTGQRRVTAELMDVILRALDTVNGMFAEIQSRCEPTPADPDLLEELGRYCQPAGEEEPVVAIPAAVTAAVPTEPAAVTSIADLSETEYRQMLDELAPDPAADSQGDDITDDEFEALLDQLHGAGKHGGVPQQAEAPVAAATAPATQAGADELIDDSEFEALLDQLHGAGKGPTAVSPAAPALSAPVADKTPGSGRRQGDGASPGRQAGRQGRAGAGERPA
jgi:two-component system, chemotaxis family, sensor kinase CheA